MLDALSLISAAPLHVVVLAPRVGRRPPGRASRRAGAARAGRQRLGVEARAGQQAQLAQRGWAHLLRLVHQQHGAPARGIHVGQPALAQRLEAAPAVVRAQGHGEDDAELAVQVGQVVLRMVDGAHRHVGQLGRARGQQTQRHALARAGVAVDHGEAKRLPR